MKKSLQYLIELQESNFALWYDWEGDFCDIKYCIGEFVLSFELHSNN